MSPPTLSDLQVPLDTDEEADSSIELTKYERRLRGSAPLEVQERQSATECVAGAFMARLRGRGRRTFVLAAMSSWRRSLVRNIKK